MFLSPTRFCTFITKFNIFSDLLYYKNFKDGYQIQDKKKNNFEENLRKGKMKRITKLYYIYTSFLDARARSTDFLILILLIDKILSDVDITFLLLILSALTILRAIVEYVATSYLTFQTRN